MIFGLLNPFMFTTLIPFSLFAIYARSFLTATLTVSSNSFRTSEIFFGELGSEISTISSPLFTPAATKAMSSLM